MGLIKQVPLDGRVSEISPATRVADAKARIAKVTAVVTESKIKLDFLKKQYDELKAQATGLGVEDTKQLPDIIARTEKDLTDYLTQLEAALAEAETLING